ncbi:receptor-like serine/threonine-protein kinase At4g25390 [Bidens hawaiensis]|uniref:receptor-like serine/threonine-protein kinase At4g25390 n=1 Tax=Bidens hawaiensis TaxID=980011 RepID=UPI0040499FF1
MPPPPPSPPPPPPPQPPSDHHHLIPPLSISCSFLLTLTLCFRKLIKTHKQRTVPSDHSKPPHKFSYDTLRTATNSFSDSNRLGRGGFGSVFRGTLVNNQQIAVKVMDAKSLQGEQEFQNELLFGGKIDSDRVVSVIGFCSEPRKRRMVLVYELMSNGSLQDCLFHRKCVELKEWKKRLSVAIDIAKGIEYLHHYCDPPIFHGDIKPSNILLDDKFNAKIADFGLARLKNENECRIEVNCKVDDGKKAEDTVLEDNGLVFEETESLATTTVCEEFSVVIDNQSPESFVTVPVAETEMSPETVNQSPRTCADASVSEANVDAMNVESGGGGGLKKDGRWETSATGKDWWWKQENRVSESGRVKDYVMEWIGRDIKERPKTEWVTTGATSGQTVKPEKKKPKPKPKPKQLDRWISSEGETKKKQKRRPAREWWKEEYCDELARKKKKNKKKRDKDENWWQKDDELYIERKKKRNRSKGGSMGNVDWWLDGFSGELWRARRNSHDSISGDIPKSGGISSAPSMRGTMCYAAPEYSSGGDLSEKCDVYSFGVLLLVLIAGRRPLQVTGSSMSEFQRANLLSWARKLARAGKLLDLVDKSVQCLDKEQALVCITVALLCLQKASAHRPSMKEVVAMLSGDLEPPPLPVEYSLSRYRRKARLVS